MAFGLWNWDIANGTLFWSDRFKLMTGVDDAGFGGKLEDFADRLHPADRVMARIDDHLEKRFPIDVQYRLRRDDGDHRRIEARGQAVWDDNGKPGRWIAATASKPCPSTHVPESSHRTSPNRSSASPETIVATAQN